MRRPLLGLSILLALGACGGGGDSTTPQTPAIAVTASATSGTIARGASSTTTITLTRSGGFTGAVSLATSGAPIGVSVTYAPQLIAAGSTSSTITISVDQSAAPGTSNLVITAAGTGVGSQVVQYALTIPTPAITVTAGSGTATAVQGTSVNVPITITRTNGALGAITLSATGLPTDATAGFTPGPIPSNETTSTMNVFVGTTTPVGTYAITVSAAGTGVTTQTATLQLTVTGAATPGYTLSATPAALSLTAGSNGTSAIAITRTAGFAGNVTLAVEGAPSGVTASFAPNPASGNTSTLTVNTTAATAPGTYNLTVRGTASGQTDRTIVVALTVNALPGVTVTLNPTSLSIAQGANAQSAVTLARVGGLTGDIAMTASGAPAGMTVAFNPATVSATSSTITVTVAGSVATGVYPITITGTGTGNVVGTATLTVTVTSAQGFTLSASNSSVVQGSTGTSTVTITRVGGYANNVDLTATNLPANVTAAFNPASVTGTTSTLTFTAAAGATPGTYSVTVNGTGTGATNQSTTVSLTVTASGGGGGAIAWKFCDPARIPLWFAYKDGASGTWTRVTAGANNTFSFTLSNSVGGVAYVQNASGGGTQGTVLLYTTSELTAQATAECTSSPDTKSLTGTFAGLTTNASQTQSGTVNIAGGTGTSAVAGTPFNITNVGNRVSDVLAYRTTTDIALGTSAIDKVILRRSVNYDAGSAVPVLDFNGAEAFAPASATITLANRGSDQTFILASFQTANGSAGSLINLFSALVLGIPASKTQAGDFHLVQATARDAGNTSTRLIAQYNRDLVDRTLTFGNTLALPTITVPGAGRLKVTGPWTAEYGDAGASAMTQGSGASTRAWTVTGSRGYFGAGSSNFEFELFDFSGVAGFQAVWGLAAGVSTQVTTNIFGTIVGTYPQVAEGSSYKSAARIQTVTP